MGVTCHVVLIETSGNQGFIFDTTKRRENVGASELIDGLRQWVDDALAVEFTDFDSATWRISDGRPAQLLVNAAGGAKIVVRDREQGTALVSLVTARALRAAPGLDVCGVVGECFDWDAVHKEEGQRPISMLARRCREAHHLLPLVKSGRAGPMSRFLRIPIVDECAASGLPAYDVVVDGDGPRSRQPRSRPSRAKRAVQDAGFTRLARYAGISNKALEAVADHLEDVPDWVAVIHADGNSLGQLITDLGNRPESASADGQPAQGSAAGDANRKTPSDRYADALGPFSAAVQECTVVAFTKALEHCERVLPPGHDVAGAMPVLPLVLGGDDLTVICAGSISLAFTEAYLTAFEEVTRAHALLGDGLTGGGLTACAGVAVVKPHFPFSAAYDLAEELTKEAKKTVKRYAPRSSGQARPRASAFSFHVQYDSGGSDPEHLRERMQVPPGAADLAAEPDRKKRRKLRALLYAQPYVVTRDMREPWTQGRHWDDLVRRAAALIDTVDELDGGVDGAQESGERKLPTSQIHDLRETLFAGRDAADGRFRQLLRHYQDRGLTLFAAPDTPPDTPDGETTNPDTASLFWRISADEPPITGLLDAMNAVQLMGDPAATGAPATGTSV
ncbi:MULTISPECIES: Cas10/Cmr2 second palm domain-containing protein [unclassified Frankia]|uniref:Cas10/Cmr2 second palm domain-containing protein n=1 Tax=unclassified Frankia TaxID=2632575 RepID=UPI002AD36103|nr:MULTISPECIES: hypothetical protein [unclassified Frankia]